MALMCVPENLCLLTRVIESPEAFKAFVGENPEYKADLLHFEANGYGAGMCNWQALPYAKIKIVILAWQIATRGDFFDVLMHELAHAATADVSLLSGPNNIKTHVYERIIIPQLHAVMYDPLTYSLIPRNIYDPKSKRIIRDPELPRLM